MKDSQARKDCRTILLLGGTGFIGTNLASALSRSGHDVVVRGQTGIKGAAFPSLPIADVDGIMSLVKERGIDTIVHLASSMIPSSSEAQYFTEQKTIMLPTMALAARLAGSDVSLVYVSSGGTVYGATSQAPAHEADACAPISFYGQAKLQIEQFLQFMGRTAHLQYLIVRPSNPYGRGQALHGAQGLISVALGKVRDRAALEVWGDGSTVRDYIHIDDLTRSLRELIEHGPRGTTVNIGSGEGQSLLEVVDVVRSVTRQPLDLLFRPSRGVDVPRLVLDVGQLRALGMHHARSLEEGVHAYATELGMVNG